MRLFLIVVMAASMYAADIHQHGTVILYTPLPEENPTLISFSNGIVFDTRDGGPVLPSHLAISSCDGDGYYLVQLKGPVYTDWLDALKNTGIDIVSYIPKYALVARASPEQIESAKQMEFVQWTGIFQPAYKLQEELFNKTGTGRVAIQLFPNTDVDDMVLQIQQLGFEIAEVIDHPLCQSIDAVIDFSRVQEIARLDAVHWIQVWTEPTTCNSSAQWVVQTGYRSSAPVDTVGRHVWHKGVRGQGTVLSTSDSGIYTAHNQFYDAAYPITSAGVFPNHRKIVAYKVYSGATFGDVAAAYWHGTHTGGTTAGNDTLLGANANDGMAKLAREYFCDIGNASGGLVVATNLTAMYDTIYLGLGLSYTILQHSGSWGWGNSSGTYLLQDASTDAYIYRYPNFLNLYAAGNEYSATTLRNPGIAKNVLTIGACGNGTTSNTIAGFSSRGPTQDNRIKPNFCAPGVSVVSAQGGTTNSYWSMDGTSMATPCSNGAVGLIRQYLLAGFYPTGTENPPDSIKYQSAALLRAMAINSTDPNIGSYTPPSFDMGWGRIDLDSLLYFSGDVRKLIIKDDTIGVSTGGSITDSFQVSSSIPLRICVAWTDTAAAASANPTLVNDLNVTLTNPSGTYYRGNQYTSGQSTTNPGTWDNRNVEECFRVNSPATGVWRLQVAGQSVPNGPMGYAYAISGDVQPLIVGVEEYNQAIPVRESFVHSTISSGKVDMSVTLSHPALVNARILDLSGRVVEVIVNQILPPGETSCRHESKLSSGVYFVEVTTDHTHQIGKLVIVR